MRVLSRFDSPPDGSHLISRGGSIELWSIAHGERVITIPQEGIAQLGIHPVEARLVLGTITGEVHFFDLLGVGRTG